MNIRKNDLIQFARDIKNQNRPAQGKAGNAANDGSEGVRTDRSPVTDRLTGQVRSLQNDMNQLQTQITFRQASVAFLQDMPASSSWSQELKKFMNQNFSTLTLTLNDAETQSDYTSRTMAEMNSLRNDLVKKEVQLQNIFSSGLVSDNNANLVKSAEEIRTMFSKLQPESVQRLLNS